MRNPGECSAQFLRGLRKPLTLTVAGQHKVVHRHRRPDIIEDEIQEIISQQTPHSLGCFVC